MKTTSASTDLVAQLDATLAEAARIKEQHRSKALLEYVAVVKGAKKMNASDLLALLDRCQLTAEDFRADAGAWRDYQGYAAAIPAEAAIVTACDEADESAKAWDQYQLDKVTEDERLKRVMSEKVGVMRSLKDRKAESERRMAELKEKHARIFG